ncbi:MAG: DUF934 domain-containing protein [Pseudomonadota bacterium]
MPLFKMTNASLAPIDRHWTEIEFTGAGDGTLDNVTDRHALVVGNEVEIAELPTNGLSAGAIILSFPKFADGRAYSQAQMLRQRRGYRGTLIARGDVLADQVLFMRRCGFDVIELSHSDAIPEALTNFDHALTAFSHFYQPAADDQPPIWLDRHRTRHKAA